MADARLISDTSTIFERSRPERRNPLHRPEGVPDHALEDIPVAQRRRRPPMLPQVSELDAVRHYTRLSQRNFSIDTQFYPLGSCTMKHNPRSANAVASMEGFAAVHPLAPAHTCQGLLACLHELQDILCAVSGMAAVSLAPMAGAHGEFAGIAMIRAYHQSRNDLVRTEIIVPDAAHGTNPATASMCGYTVREVATDRLGRVDLDALRAASSERTAGLMLTNPSTLGVFESQIVELQQIVHDAGGLTYYDGANLNAILGHVRPGDMGFDVIHMNLHKTFSTPHGGGGPGAGAVGVAPRLVPFLPVPWVIRDERGFRWAEKEDAPLSIGRLGAFAGNTGVSLRAWAYARLLGAEGMGRVADFATLNANYLMARLRAAGFTLAYPERRASHEFLLTLADLKKESGVSAMDVAKRLLDYGFHAPTVYFPLLVPECLLIEPTESESKETLDAFVDAMSAILHEARTEAARVKGAPWSLPRRRLDDVRAAREPDLTWKG